MKKTRLRDVPKGARWEHFWTYYGLRSIILVLAAALVVYTLYVAVFKPKTDFSIMIFSDQFTFDCETTMREEISSMPQWDINGDGLSRCSLNFVEFDTDQDSLSLVTRMEMLTVLSASKTHIFLANDNAAQWLLAQKLVGTFSDLTNGANPSNEVFAVSVADLPFFQAQACAPIQGLTLYISKPPEETGDYRAQMEILLELILD